MGEQLKFSIGDMYITDKVTGEQFKIGNTNETTVDLMVEYDKSLYSPLFSCAQSMDFTGSITAEGNEFLSKMYEEFEKYKNMTPKEKTLKATKGLYDTIFVPTAELMDDLIKEFGELNYVVNEYACGVIFYNSMEE